MKKLLHVLVIAALLLGTGCSHWPTPKVTLVEKPPNVVPHHGAGVSVHMSGDSVIALEILDGPKWLIVCNAPCDKVLPTRRRYRMVRTDWINDSSVPPRQRAEGLVVTNPFDVDVPEGGQVTIQMDGDTPEPPSKQSSSWLNLSW